MYMLSISSLGPQISSRRTSLGLTQRALANRARIGLSTLDALENGRLGELGFSRVSSVLTALGLELKLQNASAERPTLDDLLEEERRDTGLDRPR